MPAVPTVVLQSAYRNPQLIGFFCFSFRNPQSEIRNRKASWVFHSAFPIPNSAFAKGSVFFNPQFAIRNPQSVGGLAFSLSFC
jgi:hypothetical protein